MVRLYIVVTVLLLLINPSLGQIINQDADGKSSIVWGGSSVSVDMPDGLVKANYYRTSKDADDHFIWGVDLQAKNSNGTGDIFSKGQFTPKSELSVLIGWGGTKFDDSPSSLDSLIEVWNGKLTVRGKSADSLYRALIARIIIGCNVMVNSKDTGTKTKETQSVLDALGKFYGTSPHLLGKVSSTLQYVKDCNVLGLQIIQLMAEIESSPILANFHIAENTIDSLNNLSPTSVHNRRTLGYLRGGINTTGFKMDLGNSIDEIKLRFRDTVDVNGFIELGGTIQSGFNFFGTSIAFTGLNTFSQLKKSDYSYTSVDTVQIEGKDTPISKKTDVTAYAGNFDNYNRFSINFDYVRMIELNDSKYFSLNGYFRQNVSFDTKLEDHTTILGIGLHLIDGKKGKFLGGVYLQTDDLFGIEDKKTYEILRFGLVTKFALNSLFPQEIF